MNEIIYSILILVFVVTIIILSIMWSVLVKEPYSANNVGQTVLTSNRETGITRLVDDVVGDGGLNGEQEQNQLGGYAAPTLGQPCSMKTVKQNVENLPSSYTFGNCPDTMLCEPSIFEGGPICVSKIGQECITLNDCTKDATICLNGICEKEDGVTNQGCTVLEDCDFNTGRLVSDSSKFCTCRGVPGYICQKDSAGSPRCKVLPVPDKVNPSPPDTVKTTLLLAISDSDTKLTIKSSDLWPSSGTVYFKIGNELMSGIISGTTIDSITRAIDGFASSYPEGSSVELYNLQYPSCDLDTDCASLGIYGQTTCYKPNSDNVFGYCRWRNLPGYIVEKNNKERSRLIPNDLTVRTDWNGNTMPNIKCVEGYSASKRLYVLDDDNFYCLSDTPSSGIEGLGSICYSGLIPELTTGNQSVNSQCPGALKCRYSGEVFDYYVNKPDSNSSNRIDVGSCSGGDQSLYQECNFTNLSCSDEYLCFPNVSAPSTFICRRPLDRVNCFYGKCQENYQCINDKCVGITNPTNPVPCLNSLYQEFLTSFDRNLINLKLGDAQQCKGICGSQNILFETKENSDRSISFEKNSIIQTTYTNNSPLRMYEGIFNNEKTIYLCNIITALITDEPLNRIFYERLGSSPATVELVLDISSFTTGLAFKNSSEEIILYSFGILDVRFDRDGNIVVFFQYSTNINEKGNYVIGIDVIAKEDNVYFDPTKDTITVPINGSNYIEKCPLLYSKESYESAEPAINSDENYDVDKNFEKLIYSNGAVGKYPYILTTVDNINVYNGNKYAAALLIPQIIPNIVNLASFIENPHVDFPENENNAQIPSENCLYSLNEINPLVDVSGNIKVQDLYKSNTLNMYQEYINQDSGVSNILIFTYENNKIIKLSERNTNLSNSISVLDKIISKLFSGNDDRTSIIGSIKNPISFHFYPTSQFDINLNFSIAVFYDDSLNNDQKMIVYKIKNIELNDELENTIYRFPVGVGNALGQINSGRNNTISIKTVTNPEFSDQIVTLETKTDIKYFSINDLVMLTDLNFLGELYYIVTEIDNDGTLKLDCGAGNLSTGAPINTLLIINKNVKYYKDFTMSSVVTENTYDSTDFGHFHFANSRGILQDVNTKFWIYETPQIFDIKLGNFDIQRINEIIYEPGELNIYGRSVFYMFAKVLDRQGFGSLTPFNSLFKVDIQNNENALIDDQGIPFIYPFEVVATNVDIDVEKVSTFRKNLSSRPVPSSLPYNTDITPFPFQTGKFATIPNSGTLYLLANPCS